MYKRNKVTKLVIFLLSMVMALAMAVPVLANVSAVSEVPTIEVCMDTADSGKGDIVPVKIYIKNAVFNTAGVAFRYDASLMTPILADGSDSDSGNRLVTLENSYEDGGYFSTTQKKADKKSIAIFVTIAFLSITMVRRTMLRKPWLL